MPDMSACMPQVPEEVSNPQDFSQTLAAIPNLGSVTEEAHSRTDSFESRPTDSALNRLPPLCQTIGHALMSPEHVEYVGKRTESTFAKAPLLLTSPIAAAAESELSAKGKLMEIAEVGSLSFTIEVLSHALMCVCLCLSQSLPLSLCLCFRCDHLVYTHSHSLSLCIILVVIMGSKQLKTSRCAPHMLFFSLILTLHLPLCHSAST